MKPSRYLYTIAFFLLFINIKPVKAQIRDSVSTRELKVGDLMPDIKFLHPVNFPSGVHSFFNLRGKLVILDFWHAACTPCVALFPHLEDLQRQFSNQLVVIAMDPGENQQHAERTLKDVKESSLKSNYDIRTPIIASDYDDNIWPLLFPSSITHPFQIWIDKDGRVFSLTEPWNVTAENIQKVLDGGHPPMMQREHITAEVIDHPLLVAKQGVPQPNFYSAFFPYKDGLYARFNSTTEDSLNKTFRIAFTNLPIYSLYEAAYPQYADRIYVQATNPSEYYEAINIMDTSDDFMRNNYYSYELCIPIKSKDHWQEYMRADLNRFFEQRKGIHAVEKIENVGCWVLKLKNKRLLQSKAPDSGRESERHANNIVNVRWGNINQLKVILRFLKNKYYAPFIILDETGLKDQQFNFTLDLTDVKTIKSSMKKSGFELAYQPVKQKILSIISINRR